MILRNLHINHRQRIGLTVVFGLGFLVAGAGGARFYYLYTVTIGGNNDPTWQGYPQFVSFRLPCQSIRNPRVNDMSI